jgi:AcrR family transcriptional regulator
MDPLLERLLEAQGRHQIGHLEVAKRCGISRQTFYHALNAKQFKSPAVRRKVQAWVDGAEKIPSLDEGAAEILRREVASVIGLLDAEALQELLPDLKRRLAIQLAGEYRGDVEDALATSPGKD